MAQAKSTVKKVGVKYSNARRTPESKMDVMEVISEMDNGKRRRRSVKVRGGTWARGGGVVRVGKGTMDLMLGKEDLDTWSDEELMLGFKKHNGRGGNRKPNIIPIEVHQELQRRVISHAQHKFLANLEFSIDQLTAIIAGIETKKKKDGTVIAVDVTPVQLKALEMMIDRVMGKVKQEVELNIGKPKPYEDLLSTAIVADADAAKELEEKMAAAETFLEEQEEQEEG